jgi:sn-glycerol 3-phosphate transport system permease protein
MIHRSASLMTGMRLSAIIVLSPVARLWSTRLWWILVAALTQSRIRPALGCHTAPRFADPCALPRRLAQGDFFRWYLNFRIVVAGILVVQRITITLAGYAFARLNFPGWDLVFYLFLAQIAQAAPIVIVPNTVTIVRMGLADGWPGVICALGRTSCRLGIGCDRAAIDRFRVVPAAIRQFFWLFQGSSRSRR